MGVAIMYLFNLIYTSNYLILLIYLFTYWTPETLLSSNCQVYGKIYARQYHW